MRCLFVLLATAIPSICGNLWSWDMTELPSGWEANEYWTFDSGGAHSYVYAYTSGPYSDSETAIMLSDTMSVPDSTDCLAVSIISEWDWDGWAANGESDCMIWFRIIVIGGDWTTIEFDSHSWGFIRGNGMRSATVEVPVTGGSEFYLELRSSATSSYGAMAEMTWDVSSVSIADTLGSALDPYTWGSVKRAFITP